MDFFEFAVTDDLGGFLGFFLRLERGGLALLLAFADRSHAVGNQNGDQNADGLIPFCLMQEKQHHLHDQRHQQNQNHGVFEAL